MQTRSVQHAINTHFSEQLDVIGFYQTNPLLEIDGSLHLPEEIRHASSGHRLFLSASKKTNEAHSLVTGLIKLPGNGLRITLKNLDFSNIIALREYGARPAILSASAVLLCRETEELIVHQRSADVATHANHWHILGGAFNPLLDTADGQASMARTLQRELFEETGLHLSLPETSPLVLSKEKMSGFIQCCMLGVPVKEAQLTQLSSNWEGRIHRVGFHQLANLFNDKNWVASGKAHILCWLALGAPLTKPGQKFGTYTPQQLFEMLISAHQ